MIRPDSATGMNNPHLFPILSDHLGTPRKVLDGNTGETRWSWDAKQPFGHELPNETPTAGLDAFVFDLRFPGQRYDEETGLFQNGFRDYHPGLGRYVQSDPLGLNGGLNTYIYSLNNPLIFMDALGLDICIDSTDSSVPFGLHQRVSVYNSNGKLIHGQSFATIGERGLLDSDGSRVDGKQTEYSGRVYLDIENKTRNRIKCRKTSDVQNEKIVLPFLKNEIGKMGLYSATSINGQSCRDYSQNTFKNLDIILSISEGKK